MEEASAYIARNWSSTVRSAPEDQGTLIGLPRPFSTPSTSGVFQELYYWDTYFINVGLLASGQTEQAANNIENMFYLIDRFGWMPNGNRTFYLCRSQPPFLSQMVRELFEHTQDRAWLHARAYPALQKEYWFWHTHRTLENGLSRYGGEDPDDTTLRELGRSLCERFGLASPESPEQLYPYGRAMLALAESGWDCTSRFGTEAQLYAPVDLNALLYRMEHNMEWFAGVLGLDAERSQWRSRKEFRKARMDELLWDPERGCYCDYRFSDGHLWKAMVFSAQKSFEDAVAAHKRGHFLNALQRERRLAQRLHGDGHELHGVVVRSHAVGAERTTAPASVDDRPFAALTHPDGDRLHDAAAVAGAVAWLYVHMKAGKAVRTMVSVVAAGVFRRTEPAADLAGKRVVTGVGLILMSF